MTSFSTAATRRAHSLSWGPPQPVIEKAYQVLKAQAAEAHLINNARFGQFLSEQFVAMEKASQPTRLMLVESANHAMHFGLRIKHKEGKPSYVVKFFDANDTTASARGKAGGVQTFEMQTIASYLAKEHSLCRHYPEDRGISMIFVRHEGDAQAGAITSPGSSVGKTLTTCIDTQEMDAIAVWHLMANGFAGNLGQLHERLKALSEDQCVELLAGKNNEGFPALYMGMQNGHAQAVKAYAELLKWIPQEQRIKLLIGNTFKGIPALHIAMTSGQAEMVKAYAELLKRVPQDRWNELLVGKDKENIPALHAAMELGEAGAIKAYGELLKELVPPDKQAGLLLVKISAGPSKGQSGVHFALEEGHFEVVTEHLEMLQGLAPDLSLATCAWLKNELKGYENLVLRSRPHSSSLLQEWNRMSGTFSKLKKALMGQLATGAA